MSHTDCNSVLFPFEGYIMLCKLFSFVHVHGLVLQIYTRAEVEIPSQLQCIVTFQRHPHCV